VSAIVVIPADQQSLTPRRAASRKSFGLRRALMVRMF
jgi:hypothetical protein